MFQAKDMSTISLVLAILMFTNSYSLCRPTNSTTNYLRNSPPMVTLPTHQASGQVSQPDRIGESCDKQLNPKKLGPQGFGEVDYMSYMVIRC